MSKRTSIFFLLVATLFALLQAVPLATAEQSPQTPPSTQIVRLDPRFDQFVPANAVPFGLPKSFDDSQKELDFQDVYRIHKNPVEQLIPSA